jgi:hypothetical protein
MNRSIFLTGFSVVTRDQLIRMQLFPKCNHRRFRIEMGKTHHSDIAAEGRISTTNLNMPGLRRGGV